MFVYLNICPLNAAICKCLPCFLHSLYGETSVFGHSLQFDHLMCYSHHIKVYKSYSIIRQPLNPSPIECWITEVSLYTCMYVCVCITTCECTYICICKYLLECTCTYVIFLLLFSILACVCVHPVLLPMYAFLPTPHL